VRETPLMHARLGAIDTLHPQGTPSSTCNHYATMVLRIHTVIGISSRGKVGAGTPSSSRFLS